MALTILRSIWARSLSGKFDRACDDAATAPREPTADATDDILRLTVCTPT